MPINLLVKFICKRRLFFIRGVEFLKKNYTSCPKKFGYPFSIVRPVKKDHHEILRLMERAYYREEPTSRAVSFRPNKLSENNVIRVLNQGFSLVAKCKYNGTIVGGVLNEISNPWDADIKERLACMVKCIKTRKLLNFSAYLQKFPDLYETYDINQIFELISLFVRKEDRGKGLALKLMEVSRCLAADCAFSLFRVHATSAYTAKLCEKMKLKLVCEVPYDAYVDENEKQVFRPTPPHTSAKVYIDDELRRFKKKK